MKINVNLTLRPDRPDTEHRGELIMDTFMAEWTTASGTQTAGTFQATDEAEVRASIEAKGGTEITVSRHEK